MQTLRKRKNDKNNVVALRAVLVIDMVKAPKFLVMAAEQEEPKNPMLLKSARTVTFPATDHVRSVAPAVYSSKVPGCVIHTNPSRKSPFMAAAAEMATKAIEYMRKMNCFFLKKV